MNETIIDMLNFGLWMWDFALTSTWALLREPIQTFRGGAIWTVVVPIHAALQAIAYALLVLYFLMGTMKTFGSFVELKRPESAFKIFMRFALSYIAVSHGMDILLALVDISQGIVFTIIDVAPGDFTFDGVTAVTLPTEIVTGITSMGFWEGIPLLLLAFVTMLIVAFLSLSILLTVYGRFFRIYTYSVMSTIALAGFAGEPTHSMGVSFMRSFAGLCLEGVVIVFSCVLFTAFATAPSAVDDALPLVVQLCSYVLELLFGMLVLVGMVKGGDRLIKDMMGL